MRFGLIFAAHVCVLTLVSEAAAQSPQTRKQTLVAQAEPAAPPPATDAVPAPEPAPAEQPLLPPEPAPEPEPEPEPAPAAAAPAADKPLVRFFGIIKPTLIVANALESFGNVNFVAPTAVANPVFAPDPDDMALGWQVQQTRFGMAIGEGLPVTAKLELDFVDSAAPPGFNRSSPAQATTPRLRQAYVEWSITEGHKLTIGQLWDFFSPLNNHTYNLVGNLFQSGNVGFMRHQLGWTGNFGPIEAALVLGLTAQNLTPTLNGVEFGKVPTFVPRVSYRRGKELWVGVSAIASRITLGSQTPAEDTKMVFGGNAFADTNFGAMNLRAEVYGGQNLANLGVLSLAQVTPAEDISEIGGYVSAKYTINPSNSAHVVVGGAAVLNTDDMALGYTPADATAGTPATRSGVGIQNNFSLRAGYAYTPYAGFSLVFEPFLILTKHKLDPVAEAAFGESRKGGGVEFGGLYTF
jgi:hypothetical protein